MDQTIFGLRFKSNEAIHPRPEELNSFLESPKKGAKEKHKEDLTKYLQYLEHIEAFEAQQKQGMAHAGFNEKMIFGVLSHSHFFKRSLKSAIEQYKYHYHRLSLLDFKKPTDFIRSAEEEIKKLNPKKKDDHQKIDRLQGMISQRNEDIEALKKRWAAQSEELHNITVYIKENLLKIQKLCESTIVILVGLQVGGEKTTQLIEDIKTHFKERVRDYLQLGPVTKQFIETLKTDVEKLSRQLSQQVLEDIYSVTRVYEAVHDHAKKIIDNLDGLLNQIKTRQRNNIDEERNLFGRVEQVLVSLVSEFDFESVKLGETPNPVEHEKLLFEKRKEMLDHVFELLAR